MNAVLETSDALAGSLGEHNAIVVAHPDDETLFAGGLPLRFNDRSWTIICCSIPRIDPIRAWKFQVACMILGALPKLLPFAESEPNLALPHLEALGNLAEYDTLVTHNEHGDYGHLHHAQVCEYVSAVANGRPVVHFGYHRKGHGAEELKLTNEEFATKMVAMQQYNHILPYEGENLPKWQALHRRYYGQEGLDPKIETYDIGSA